jgi:hypothetical protein
VSLPAAPKTDDGTCSSHDDRTAKVYQYKKLPVSLPGTEASVALPED